MPQNSAGVDWHDWCDHARGCDGGRIALTLPLKPDDEGDKEEVTALLWRIVEGCEPWFLIDRLPYVEDGKMRVQLVLKEGVE